MKLLSIIISAFFIFTASSNAFACDCDQKESTQKTADAKTDKTAAKEDKKDCACKRKNKDQKNSKASEDTPCDCGKKDA